MNDFLAIMAKIFEFFQFELNIYGHTFTLWHVFMFSLITSVVFGFIGGVLHDK